MLLIPKRPLYFPRKAIAYSTFSAIAVFARAFYQFFLGASPAASVMGGIGLVALLANLLCLMLLTRHCENNLNVTSM